METDKPKLVMIGGLWGGLVPLIVLIGILIGLSIGGTAGIKALWTAGWLALLMGLFFAKNKSFYCTTLIKGLGDNNGIVIVTAWLFAGVFGKLMVAGGLVSGLLWVGLKTGANGALFAFLSFLTAMIFSMGTGTSTGTVLSLVPVLYPAGVFLGANPAVLALGILSGAAFGDNLAPISDTTIVSAYTQEARMKDVVRSRFPLSITAAFFSGMVIFLFGGGGDIQALPEIQAQINPLGMLMLFSFAVVVISALMGRHLIESLIYGNVSAIFIGMITGHIRFSQLFRIPATTGESSGIIQEGINSVVGAIIFALLMLGITQVLIESGVMAKILKKLEQRVVKSVKQAELFIVLSTITASIPIASNAAAELLVGPSLVKSLGAKFNLAPARKANLMDCAVCSIFYTLPWHIAVVVWYGALQSAADTFQLSALPISISFLNPYSWALLAVLLVSALTGWNRKFTS
ncbi:MAG: sodium:proton antiporter [Candidatus Aminicenantes bacterium]|nr:sodium:proton antiporter [Candidatus Aminicenantes bacterium]